MSDLIRNHEHPFFSHCGSTNKSVLSFSIQTGEKLRKNTPHVLYIFDSLCYIILLKNNAKEKLLRFFVFLHSSLYICPYMKIVFRAFSCTHVLFPYTDNMGYFK